MYRREKVEAVEKQVAALLEENGLSYSEVESVLCDVKDQMRVVGLNSGVVYRNGKPYERKPYAKEYTPVAASDRT